jgi:hypothetical protein
MHNAEIRQRIIGLLTLAYNTDFDPSQTDEEAVEEFANAVDALMEGWGGYSLDLSLPAYQAAEVQDAIQHVMNHVGRDVTAIVSHFTQIFLALCRSVEQDYSDVDIPGFLRQVALDAASGGTEES